MLTKEQIKQVEHSFKHSNVLVAQIGNKVYACERTLKHKKEGTIELRECYEIDESCFHQGKDEEDYGETVGKEKNFILEDCYAGNDNLVASVYYDDEIKEVW